MNTKIRTLAVLAIACIALASTACKKEEAPQVEAVAAPLSAPKDDNTASWRAYVTDVAKRNMDGVTNSPYVYFLPSESTEGFGGQYERQLEKLEGDLARGILGGNMLVFASPSFTKEAEMIETAFKPVPANSMKDVKVVYIGTPIDGERVKAAVTPAGVNYIFVEAK